VGIVVQFMQEHHELHWKVAKRILHYIQGTLRFGIHYAAGCDLDLVGYMDYFAVGNATYCKFTSGYLFSLGSSGPICWSSKKQSTIALSTTEAEYRGAVNAAATEEAIHIVAAHSH